MKNYRVLDRDSLHAERKNLSSAIGRYADEKHKLIMARGKPSAEQLDISLPMLDVLNSSSDLRAEGGVDCRNYGEPTGILDAKKLFGAFMGVGTDEIFIGGSSSLVFMSNILSCCMLRGVRGSREPWVRVPGVKFVCPVPGYDRHFKMCEHFGIGMINVALDEKGPDMDEVERLVRDDESVKGIWCVPKYANPTGTSYADEVVERLANMRAAAADFRIFWDNAYAVHHVYREVELANLLDACKRAGNPDRVYMFGSTSKITFPGAGVCCFAASKENIDFVAKELGEEGAGWDKLNMLRHVRFLKNMDNVKKIMDRHAAIIRGRFDIVIGELEKELLPRGVGRYLRPDGGYFVTYRSEPGCAKRIVELCGEVGVVLTSAGATHPYGKDPDDTYIRLAPTSTSAADLEKAMEIFCVVARFVTAEKILGE